MATLVFRNGKQRAGIQTFETSTYNAARNVQCVWWDDNATTPTVLQTDVVPDPTTSYDQDITALSGTIGTSGDNATVTIVISLATGVANFTHVRIYFHDDAAATVSASTATVFAVIYGLSLTKTSDFTMQYTFVFTIA